jgi:hypothetical protein
VKSSLEIAQDDKLAELAGRAADARRRALTNP